MIHNTAPPHALEQLQVRALAFRDRVEELLAPLSHDDDGEPSAPEDWSELSDTDAASQALAEILAGEDLRSKFPIPDWFGPVEQLTLQAASSLEELWDEGDRAIAEVEGHGSHSLPCRCYQLLDFLHEGFAPAVAEYERLSEAIVQFRHSCRPRS